jgi:hypothetical protein
MHTWQSKIADLVKLGMSLTEIGEIIGLAPASMSDLSRGETKSPRGDAALELHQLWLSRCGDKSSANAA